MYRPPAPNSFTPTTNTWQCAAIFCVGLLGFLIAAVIVLALIPIYIPNKDVTIANTTSTFYVEYYAAVSIGNFLTGTVNNYAEVGTAAGVGSIGKFLSGRSQATLTRRRRGLLTLRQKRALRTRFYFVCQPIFPTGCAGQNCRNIVTTTLQQNLQKNSNFTITFSITSNGVSKSVTYTLILVGFSSTIPSGFATDTTSSNFTAVQSGLFTSNSTWINGIIPYGDATIIIPSGITVTIAGSIFEIPVAAFYVSGTLAVGQGATTFQFLYSTSIIVQANGMFTDLTTSNSITVTTDTLIIALDNSVSLSNGTTITIGSTSGKRAIGNIFRMTGIPFTLGIIDSIGLAFPRINPICKRNGGILSGSSYLGGFAPSSAICSISGCGIYIPSGVSITTSEVNGVVPLRINYVRVASGGTFSMGSSGVSGFTFTYVVQMEIYGTLNYIGNGGSVRIPGGSACNMYSGATFVATVTTSVSIVSVDSSGNPQGSALPLVTNTQGPFYIDVPVNTGPTNNTLIPAGNSTISGVGMTTAAPIAMTATPFIGGG